MTDQVDGRDVMAEFVPASPMVRHLGIRLEALDQDAATLVLPFDENVSTIGTIVHGGAIATLADTAAMAAAWSGTPAPDSMRGTTVDLTVHYPGSGRRHRPGRPRTGAAARAQPGAPRRRREHAGRGPGRARARDVQAGLSRSTVVRGRGWPWASWAAQHRTARRGRHVRYDTRDSRDNR